MNIYIDEAIVKKTFIERRNFHIFIINSIKITFKSLLTMIINWITVHLRPCAALYTFVYKKKQFFELNSFLRSSNKKKNTI